MLVAVLPESTVALVLAAPPAVVTAAVLVVTLDVTSPPDAPPTVDIDPPSTVLLTPSAVDDPLSSAL